MKTISFVQVKALAAVLLSLVFTAGVSAIEVPANGVISESGDYTLQMQPGDPARDNPITVNTGVTANITLVNVRISASGAALDIKDAATVNLTSAAGVCELTCTGSAPAISVSEHATLTIVDGSLNVNGGAGNAGIGGSGTVIVNGGGIVVYGGAGGAGISNDTVIINGGYVDAYGRGDGAGITGIVTINGGTVHANGTVDINGGEVNANGAVNGAGIAGTVDINGGTVHALGRGDGAGITGIVTINGGTVYAEGYDFGAAIDGTVTIHGGTVTAFNRYEGSGISGTVAIHGGTVTAESYTWGVSISGTVTIHDGTVYAIGGGDNAGISGTVTIHDGTVNATGGGNNAAIDGTVTIHNGTVTAIGGGGAFGFGSEGTVIFTGGNIIGLMGTGTPQDIEGRPLYRVVADFSPNIVNDFISDSSYLSVDIDGIPYRYTINAIKTDESGKAYFWLPAGVGEQEILLIKDGVEYRNSNALTITGEGSKELHFVALDTVPSSSIQHITTNSPTEVVPLVVSDISFPITNSPTGVPLKTTLVNNLIVVYDTLPIPITNSPTKVPLKAAFVDNPTEYITFGEAYPMGDGRKLRYEVDTIYNDEVWYIWTATNRYGVAKYYTNEPELTHDIKFGDRLAVKCEVGYPVQLTFNQYGSYSGTPPFFAFSADGDTLFANEVYFVPLNERLKFALNDLPIGNYEHRLTINGELIASGSRPIELTKDITGAVKAEYTLRPVGNVYFNNTAAYNGVDFDILAEYKADGSSSAYSVTNGAWISAGGTFILQARPTTGYDGLYKLRAEFANHAAIESVGEIRIPDVSLNDTIKLAVIDGPYYSLTRTLSGPAGATLKTVYDELESESTTTLSQTETTRSDTLLPDGMKTVRFTATPPDDNGGYKYRWSGYAGASEQISDKREIELTFTKDLNVKCEILPECKIEYGFKDGEVYPDLVLNATYDGNPVANGAIVVAGKKLFVEVIGSELYLYRFNWEGVDNASGKTIVSIDVDGHKNIQCFFTKQQSVTDVENIIVNTGYDYITLQVGDTLTVGKDVLNVSLKVTPIDSINATISYDEWHTLAYGANTLTVKVVSEDELERVTHRITIVRGDDSSQPTGIASPDASPARVYSHAQTLYIDTPEAEQISVYSLTGNLLNRFDKPAGVSSYQAIAPAVIVKGSSGWVRKVLMK
ncbi:MAG: carbohydrate-binding domain-containing protein [Dysgonamonadaceae bacterium]|nr:carbohydrate-binding domain-containing protein [Dysgonamonadaceae bacterium]